MTFIDVSLFESLPFPFLGSAFMAFCCSCSLVQYLHTVLVILCSEEQRQQLRMKTVINNFMPPFSSSGKREKWLGKATKRIVILARLYMKRMRGQKNNQICFNESYSENFEQNSNWFLKRTLISFLTVSEFVCVSLCLVSFTVYHSWYVKNSKVHCRHQGLVS